MKAHIWIITLIVFALSWGTVAQAVQTSSTVILGPCWVKNVKDGDTITVRLSSGDTMEVRYRGINAPELSDRKHLGQAAKDANSALVGNRNVWLEVEKINGDFHRGRDRRVLAYVFLDASCAQLAQEELAREGLGIIDFPDLIDREVAENDFPVRYTDQLIAAQMEAAKNRQGVRSLDDFYPSANLAIAAIKFWGEKERVYLINRGNEPIELATGWILMDASGWKSEKEGEKPQHAVSFDGFFGPSCVLPPGGTLSIYTGPGTPMKMNGRVTGCGTKKVEAYLTRRKVWNNNGDTAYLLGPDGKPSFVYAYPPFRKSKRYFHRLGMLPVAISLAPDKNSGMRGSRIP